MSGFRKVALLAIWVMASVWVAAQPAGAAGHQEARINLTQEERAFLREHPVIRVHNEKDWPPFNFFEDEKPQGFSIDYMNLLAAKIGVKVQYVTGPTWNEFLGMMKSGDLDVMLNIVRTPEREKYLLYTKPYAFNPNSILSLRTVPYKNLEQLFGKTVALPKGFFYEEILKRDFPLVKLHLTKNVLESMKAVIFGKADAALGELAVFNYFMEREMMTPLVVSGEVKLGGSNYSELQIATRKDLPVLASILLKAMNAVTPKEVKGLRQSWVSVSKKDSPHLILRLTGEEKAWLAKHQRIRLGVDPSYPPFDFVGEDGKYAGMASDYARLMSERLGITMEMVPGLSWSQVIEGVKSGAVDVLPAVTKTPERSKFMNFSREHLNFPDVIFMRDDHDLVAGMSDMKGRKLSFVKGYATLQRIRTNYPSIKTLLLESPLLALKAVAEGRAEATVQNLGVATYLIKKHELTNLVVAAPADLGMPGLSFGVRKDWPELVPIINKALASITPEEEAAIREKWGSTQYQIGFKKATVLRVGMQVAVAAAVILFLIVLWNWRLRREVRQRKLAEEAVHAAESRLRDAIESLPVSFILWDAEDRLVLKNKKADEFLPIHAPLMIPGVQFIDLIRQTLEKGLVNVPLEQQEAWIKERYRVFKGGGSFDQTFTNGNSFVTSYRPTSEGGTVVIRMDITERKKSEKALEEAYGIIKDQKNRMEDELNIGREIQLSMIPLEFPPFPDNHEFSIFAVLEPAREVGGDFYDFFFLDEHRLCFCIGDVSGKGVPAALFMAMTKTLIKSRAGDDPSTASIITHVNDELSEESHNSMFVTVFIGILDINTGSLTFTNAGHNPPYLKRANGEIERMDTPHGLVIGVLSGETYEEGNVLLEPGDLIFMYTDGVTEQMDELGGFFSENRLAQLLNYGTANSEESTVKQTVAAVDEFRGEIEQSDDITILALRYLGDSSQELQGEMSLKILNELSEIPKVQSALKKFAGKHGLGKMVSQRIHLVFEELLSNVISYGFQDDGAHAIEIKVELNQSRVTSTIKDDGLPFNPINVQGPDTGLPVEHRTEGGLGVHLVRNMVDEIAYQRRINKNVLTFSMYNDRNA